MFSEEIHVDGCAHCGRPERAYHYVHGNMWDREIGFHTWIEPSNAQRLERMRARRAARGK
jgi:hypothetical protein